MPPASGSEFYPARNARSPLTRGFLLGHRHRTQTNEQPLPLPSFSNPPTPLPSRGVSSNSRRKRSSETVFLTNQDGGGKSQQENKRIRPSCYTLTQSHVPNETGLENKRIRPSCHPLTQSHVPNETSLRELLTSNPRKTGDVDSIALRVKVRQFSATARSATGASTASTSAFAPACCCNSRAFSAHKPRSTSVFKLHSTNVASPFEDKSGRSFPVPSRTRSRIKLPPVRLTKGKGSETSTASPSSLPSSSSSSSSPAPLPANFDVGHPNLTPTCTTYRDRLASFFDPSTSSSSQFPSFDALDDLTRWGMDAMTFLSTSPTSDASNIDQTTAATNSDPNSKDTDFSNPFSTPFGDDDILENEIPFPSTRPRVVLEPMGVKKTKTLAADRARILTASNAGLASNPRSRYLIPFNPSSRPPPTLPHPLPSLQSASSPSPLNDDSLARTSSYLRRIAAPSQLSPDKLIAAERDRASSPDSSSSSSQDSDFQPFSSAPLSSSDSGDPKTALGGNLRKKFAPPVAPLSRNDLGDRQRISLEDFDLSVMFPQTPHYEVWDMSDHGWVSVPALLCLMVKDPKQWIATPLATPDVSLIELKCHDNPLPVRFASLCSEPNDMASFSPSSRPLSPSVSCRPNTYSTDFLGGKSAMDESSFSPRKRGMSMINAMKKHEEEQKMAKDRISLEGKWTRTFGLPGVGGCDIKRKQSGISTREDKLPARGWYLKFWIPIPTRLFLKRETRMFTITAQIWMVDQREEKPDRFETGLVDEWSGDDDGVPSLETKTEMTMSHLRRERDMDSWWQW